MSRESGKEVARLFLCFVRKMLASWASCADGESRLVSIYFEIRAIVGFPAGLGGDRRVQEIEESGRIINVLLE